MLNWKATTTQTSSKFFQYEEGNKGNTLDILNKKGLILFICLFLFSYRSR